MSSCWGFYVNAKDENLRYKHSPRSPFQLSRTSPCASSRASAPSASIITSRLLTSHSVLCWPGALYFYNQPSQHSHPGVQSTQLYTQRTDRRNADIWGALLLDVSNPISFWYIPFPVSVPQLLFNKHFFQCTSSWLTCTAIYSWQTVFTKRFTMLLGHKCPRNTIYTPSTAKEWVWGLNIFL